MLQFSSPLLHSPRTSFVYITLHTAAYSRVRAYARSSFVYSHASRSASSAFGEIWTISSSSSSTQGVIALALFVGVSLIRFARNHLFLFFSVPSVDVFLSRCSTTSDAEQDTQRVFVFEGKLSIGCWVTSDDGTNYNTISSVSLFGKTVEEAILPVLQPDCSDGFVSWITTVVIYTYPQV